MQPGRVSGYTGFLWDHQKGRWVKFWSPERFPLGYVIWAKKTINDWIAMCDVRKSKWMNGDDPDADVQPTDYIQGMLSL